jgi:phosphoribosylanthranilate isomerase
MGFVKLCGMVTAADVRAATDAGADAVGLVIDFPPSPRSLDLETAAALAAGSKLPVVALLVDPDKDALRSVIDAVSPWAIQLSGDESIGDVAMLKKVARDVELWKVIHVPAGVSPEGQGPPLEPQALIALADAYRGAGIDRVVLDAQHEDLPGGTGLRLEWSRIVDVIEGIQMPVVLAGGLTPSTVAQAIALSGAAAVDVSSGIESAPGVKDPERMHLFVQIARSAFEE